MQLFSTDLPREEQFYDPCSQNDFTLAWNYIPEQWEDKPDGTSKAILPSSTFDVSAYQRIYKGFSAFAEINNLTDEHRAENEYAVNGSTSSEKVETYGRTFLAGVKWQF